jgi:hypothetical protein
MEAAWVLLVLVVIGVIQYCSHAAWVNGVPHTAWYSTDSSEVAQYRDKLLSDGDFLRAPIGSKSCHYNKHVDVQEPLAANGNRRSVIASWPTEDEDK